MTKYSVKYTSIFKKQLKKIIKQGKDVDKLFNVVDMLANDIILDVKYKDHSLLDNKYYKKCRECHIEPDWLLIYKYENDSLILFLVSTGSHSDLLNM